MCEINIGEGEDYSMTITDPAYYKAPMCAAPGYQSKTPQPLETVPFW
jgi:hypothetical protein